jgi:hypothetical protein
MGVIQTMTKRGGAREGAGRKRLGRKPISFRIKPELIKKLRDSKLTQTQIIEDALIKYFDEVEK